MVRCVIADHESIVELILIIHLDMHTSRDCCCSGASDNVGRALQGKTVLIEERDEKGHARMVNHS